MILSLAYLVMGFFSICIAGLPLTYYAFCESRQQLEWNESKKVNLLWAMSPFVGVSVIVGILKLLVCCDIPVKYSAWPLFALSVLSFWVYTWLWWLYCPVRIAARLGVLMELVTKQLSILTPSRAIRSILGVFT